MITSSNINWSSYFDRIYMIHFLPYINRKTKIEKELDRIGILNSGIFEWKYTFRSFIDKAFLKVILVGDTRPEIVMSNIMAYYNIFQDAIWNDYKHVLILEDDVAFTKDIDLIKIMLDHMPKDYDYIHFDRMRNQKDYDRLKKMKFGVYYHNNYIGGMWGMATTAFSKKAMEIGTKIIEKRIMPSDYILENHDDPSLSELKRFAAAIPILYQPNRAKQYDIVSRGYLGYGTTFSNIY